MLEGLPIGLLLGEPRGEASRDPGRTAGASSDVYPYSAVLSSRSGVGGWM